MRFVGACMMFLSYGASHDPTPGAHFVGLVLLIGGFYTYGRGQRIACGIDPGF